MERLRVRRPRSMKRSGFGGDSPYSELAGWDPADSEAARLTELHRVATEDFIDAELACGRHIEHVADIEAMVAAEPLRERRWAMLMLALYRCGQQADALRTYQRARIALAELGIEPGPELRDMERAVIAQDESLGVPPAIAEAASMGSEVGRRASVTTENVTVLFTDMVDSTTLASHLAPDAADEVRRGHFAILRQAVAEAGGTEVKNLGDGLMVVFGVASAALSCAVAMQQGIERDNRLREHLVGVRIGLSGGEVNREDDDYFGDPVIEAARLCARCESGQILAADIVRLTAGRRSRHECRSLGKLALKGMPDPVDTVEVLWEPLEWADTEASDPAPGASGRTPRHGCRGPGSRDRGDVGCVQARREW